MPEKVGCPLASRSSDAGAGAIARLLLTESPHASACETLPKPLRGRFRSASEVARAAVRVAGPHAAREQRGAAAQRWRLRAPRSSGAGLRMSRDHRQRRDERGRGRLHPLFPLSRRRDRDLPALCICADELNPTFGRRREGHPWPYAGEYSPRPGGTLMTSDAILGSPSALPLASWDHMSMAEHVRPSRSAC